MKGGLNRGRAGEAVAAGGPGTGRPAAEGGGGAGEGTGRAACPASLPARLNIPFFSGFAGEAAIGGGGAAPAAFFACFSDLRDFLSPRPDLSGGASLNAAGGVGGIVGGPERLGVGAYEPEDSLLE